MAAPYLPPSTEGPPRAGEESAADAAAGDQGGGRPQGPAAEDASDDAGAQADNESYGGSNYSQSPEERDDAAPAALEGAASGEGGGEANDLWDDIGAASTEGEGGEASDLWDDIGGASTEGGGVEASDLWDDIGGASREGGGVEATRDRGEWTLADAEAAGEEDLGDITPHLRWLCTGIRGGANFTVARRHPVDRNKLGIQLSTHHTSDICDTIPSKASNLQLDLLMTVYVSKTIGNALAALHIDDCIASGGQHGVIEWRLRSPGSYHYSTETPD